MPTINLNWNYMFLLTCMHVCVFVCIYVILFVIRGKTGRPCCWGETTERALQVEKTF